MKTILDEKTATVKIGESQPRKLKLFTKKKLESEERENHVLLSNHKKLFRLCKYFNRNKKCNIGPRLASSEVELSLRKKLSPADRV